MIGDEVDGPTVEHPAFDQYLFTRWPGDVVRTSVILKPEAVGAPERPRPGGTCTHSPVDHVDGCPWVRWCALGCPLCENGRLPEGSLWARNSYAFRREVMPGEHDLSIALRRRQAESLSSLLRLGLVDADGEPTAFITTAEDGSGFVRLEEGPPADWRPLASSPLWDDLDLYRDDVVDPHATPRHATRRSAALAARGWVQDAPGRVWGVLCETGRFLRAFPVLAAALAERWSAEARAISDHEYVRGYEAGRRAEAAARGDEETKR